MTAVNKRDDDSHQCATATKRLTAGGASRATDGSSSAKRVLVDPGWRAGVKSIPAGLCHGVSNKDRIEARYPSLSPAAASR